MGRAGSLYQGMFGRVGAEEDHGSQVEDGFALKWSDGKMQSEVLRAFLRDWIENCLSVWNGSSEIEEGLVWQIHSHLTFEETALSIVNFRVFARTQYYNL